MIIPDIHMNGTSREALLEQLENAGSAAYKLLEALREASPNGRDYYTLGEGSLKQAEVEHRSRVDRVQSVLNELTEIAEAIAD